MDHEIRSSRPAGQHGEILSLLKIQKISWVWWHMPIIPATWEAEMGESLDPREVTPLHSSLGNRDSVSNIKHENNFQTT